MSVRYRSIVAGFILGCVSVFVTLHLNSLVAIDSNIAVRTLKAAAFALAVPGLIVALLAGNAHAFRPSIMAGVNFIFWFGFGWLFATFLAKFFQLRRAIAAVGTSDRSSSLGSQ